METNWPTSTSEEQPNSSLPDLRSFAQPLWRTALFVVLSFGLYLLPWSNRCWRCCNTLWAARNVGTHRSPWGRSLTFLIPLYGWFYAFYRLAADVEDATDAQAALGPGALNIFFIAAWIIARVFPLPWTCLGLACALVPILAVQAQVNGICERAWPGSVARKRFSKQSYVGIPLGIALWGIIAFALIAVDRVSTGVAALSFGHDVDTGTMRVLLPAAQFTAADHMVWMAHLNGRLGETSVPRTIDLTSGKTPVSIASDTLTLDNGDVHTVYEEIDLSTLGGVTTLEPGTYRVRLWRGTTIIAQGSFGIGGPPAYSLYTPPTAKAAPVGLAVARDGSVWFTERDGNRIGVITPRGTIAEYRIPTPESYPLRIARGADGNLWFTEAYTASVARITPRGVITAYALADPDAYPKDIALGPDGNLWFVEHNINRVGMLTPDGAVREFPLGAKRYPLAIAVGQDHNLWFMENAGSHFAVARMTPTGRVTLYPLATSDADAGLVTAGPDGNIWFTETLAGVIGRITPRGVITTFPLPTNDRGPLDIVAASDGNLWFSENGYALLGRITPRGAITEYRIPNVNGKPYGADILVAGPRHTLWASMPEANRVLRLDLDSLPAPI